MVVMTMKDAAIRRLAGRQARIGPIAALAVTAMLSAGAVSGPLSAASAATQPVRPD